MSYPIEEVRKQFPALSRTYNGKQVVYFDGPGGSQVHQSVIDAISKYMTKGGANLHGQFPSSVETEEHIANARQAVADLIGAEPDEVAFGANSTTLAFAIGRSLSKLWTSLDNIVVTEMDHRANVDPWISAAKDTETEVRFIPVNNTELTLDLSNLETLITTSTKLVAVTLASNAVGTITELPKISKRAREVGALLIVDAVHAVPHFYVDRDKIGADIVLCSAYKFFGPHIGMAVIKKELFQNLSVYKLDPAPSYFPEKLETGTQNHEGLAGIPSAIKFIADLGVGDTIRKKIISGYQVIEEHENRLAKKLRTELKQLSEVTVFEAPESISKTPTIAFLVKGYSPNEVCKWLADNHAIFVADGDFYASTLAGKLGINESGGWIRAGLAPYNSEEEVDLFILAIKSLIA